MICFPGMSLVFFCSYTTESMRRCPWRFLLCHKHLHVVLDLPGQEPGCGHIPMEHRLAMLKAPLKTPLLQVPLLWCSTHLNIWGAMLWTQALNSSEGRKHCKFKFFWLLTLTRSLVLTPGNWLFNLGDVTCVALHKLMGRERETSTMGNSNTLIAESPSGRAFNFSLTVWGVHSSYSPKLDTLVQCPKLC